jgi:hypothetical protein
VERDGREQRGNRDDRNRFRNTAAESCDEQDDNRGEHEQVARLGREEGLP